MTLFLLLYYVTFEIQPHRITKICHVLLRSQRDSAGKQMLVDVLLFSQLRVTVSHLYNKGMPQVWAQNATKVVSHTHFQERKCRCRHRHIEIQCNGVFRQQVKLQQI